MKTVNAASRIASLVPKLSLGTHLPAKLWFAGARAEQWRMASVPTAQHGFALPSSQAALENRNTTGSYR